MEEKKLSATKRSLRSRPPLPSAAPWLFFSCEYGENRTKIKLLTDKEEHNTKDEQEKKTNTSNDEKQVQGRSENGVELGEEKQSGVLNKEILELITNYLPPVDYLHLRAVSREHRSLLPAANWGTYFAEISMKITSLSPLLVFSEHNGCIYNFLDPMHNNEKYLMNGQKDLLGATIRFSRGGWLLMTKGKRNIFFYNPFTRARIDLPNLPHPFTIMSFSSSPTSSDCAVFCITEDFDEDYEENIFVAVITKGDNVWHSGTYPKRNFWACFNNPLFFNGAFYCVDYKGNLGIFKINGGVSQEVVASPQLHLNSSYPKFLVEHERELLLVDLGRLGTSIRVLRLDFSTNSWVRVESLGNHMMFISNTSCMFAIAPNSGMKNKIYLPRLHGEDILFYSLETDMCHSIGSQSSVNGFYDTREQLNCSWIEPNCLRKTTVEELDWFNI